ncbi:MAG TPA: lactate utilization protein [Tepidisphaeraceae bacterium]|nr:lactate utilization protein [Tepidisphaeraceae bacterium]
MGYQPISFLLQNIYQMPDPSLDTVLQKVRRSLGRVSPLSELPVPPVIPEEIVRLVPRDADLPAVFQKAAMGLKMLVSMVDSESIIPKLTEFLHSRNVERIMLSDTTLLKRWNMTDVLHSFGFEAKWWSELTLDDAYEFDAGLTEVDYAVAETGTLAIRHRPEHGRLLSLVPFVHVAVIEREKFVPDLLDLMELLRTEGFGSGVTLISGPSKTADIEMNVVTGVHGPNVVHAVVL